MATLAEFSIGPSVVGLVNLESLTIPVKPPKSFFQQGGKLLSLGSLKTKWVGKPQAIWRWGILSRSQRDQLRTFCTDASTSLYIRTRTNDTVDQYKNYLCNILWPPGEDRDFTRRVDFVLRFNNMIEQ